MDTAGEDLQANNCLERCSLGLSEDNLEQSDEKRPVQERLVHAAPRSAVLGGRVAGDEIRNPEPGDCPSAPPSSDKWGSRAEGNTKFHL